MQLTLDERHVTKNGTCYREFLGDSDTIAKAVIDENSEKAKSLKGQSVSINGKVSKVLDARVGSYCNLVNRRLYLEILTDEEFQS
jgi:hypothetical protein